MSDSPRPDVCAVDACDRQGPYTRGWCRVHYGRWQRHGNPTKGRYFSGPAAEVCALEGCARGGKVVRGLCQMHYSRWKRTGRIGVAVPVSEHREHGTEAGYWQHYRNNEECCPPCRTAHRAYQKQVNRKPEVKARRSLNARARSGRRYAKNSTAVRDQIRQSGRRLQNNTVDEAHRNGQVWTGPEMELLLTRDDLSNEDLAKMLGRTYYAVARRRKQLKRERRLPGRETKLVRLAGVT